MRQYIELSYPLEPGMPTLPFSHHPLTEFIQTGRICMEGSQAHRIVFGTHTGTHIDAPNHMIQDAKPGVDQIPLERLIGPAKLLKLKKGEQETIEPEDLEPAKLKQGDRLLISTGWGKQWGSKKFYFDFPYFSQAAVMYLVEKKVWLVGMDIPAPEPMGLPAGDPRKNWNHKAFFRGDVFIVEGMANLDQIPVNEFQLIVLPLRARNMDGFPVRAVAVCEV
ncbi:MAG: cyclase family protein [Lawsonibacter sp.]|jgi:arylformamidase